MDFSEAPVRLFTFFSFFVVSYLAVREPHPAETSVPEGGPPLNHAEAFSFPLGKGAGGRVGKWAGGEVVVVERLWWWWWFFVSGSQKLKEKS